MADDAPALKKQKSALAKQGLSPQEQGQYLGAQQAAQLPQSNAGQAKPAGKEAQKPQLGAGCPAPASGASSKGGPGLFQIMDIWTPTPTQTLVLGGGLVALNFLAQGDFSQVLARLWEKPASAADAQSHTKFTRSSLLQLGGEVFFVFVLAFFTGFSPALGRAILLFILALYLVWFVHNGPTLSTALLQPAKEKLGGFGSSKGQGSNGGNDTPTGVKPQ
jgi:hypothetical protein